MKERTKLAYLIIIYLIAYFMQWDHPAIRQSGLEAFMMLQEYAREHVLNCLIPAFFIAGAVAVFVSQASVLKYFGAQAKKVMAYSVASVSGTILAVCSCTSWRKLTLGKFICFCSWCVDVFRHSYRSTNFAGASWSRYG